MAINYRVTTVNSTLYLVAGSDEIVMVNVAGPATVILPSDVEVKSKSRVLYIKDYTGGANVNPITVTSAGEKTIDGVSSVILDHGYAHIQVVYDGKNWKTISHSSQSGNNKKKKLRDYLKIFSIS